MTRRMLAVLALVFQVGPGLPGLAATPVRIGTVMPLDTENTVYSQRFQRGFEGAIFFAIGEVHEELAACGYTPELDFRYYGQDAIVGASSPMTTAAVSDARTTTGPSSGSSCPRQTRLRPPLRATHDIGGL